MLRTDTVEKSTLVLLKNLQQMPIFAATRLVGGTALALQLGHRFSVDLDFFGKIELAAIQIADELTERGFSVSIQQDSKFIKTFFINGIKVDVVNLNYEWLAPCIEIENVRMAQLPDIAAMKLEAVTNRGSRKDFVDVYFLLQHFTLEQMLELYLKRYPQGTSFNVLRSLTYFRDAEELPMPKMFASVDWREITEKIKETVVKIN